MRRRIPEDERRGIKAAAKAAMLEAMGVTDFGEYEAEIDAFLDRIPLVEGEEFGVCRGGDRR